MSRDSNIEVFEHTMKTILESDDLLASIGRSISAQKKKKKIVPLQDRRWLKGKTTGNTPDASIRVSADRSFEAAAKAAGHHTAVLNFASWHVPGGGVELGANAQEEALCRISTLFPCLNDERMDEQFYGPHRLLKTPLYSDELIYTPDVLVIKTDTDNPQLLPPDKWMKTDVISMAAPNIGALRHDVDFDLDDLYRRRIGKVLGAAYDHGADTVVLGAFGCGVFGNDPQRVATAMADVIESCRKMFRKVEIPVFCPPYAQKPNNLTVFSDVFASRFGKGVLDINDSASRTHSSLNKNDRGFTR